MPRHYLIADNTGLILQYEFGNDSKTVPPKTLDDLGTALRELKEGIEDALRTDSPIVKTFIDGKKFHTAHIAPLPESLYGRPTVISILQDNAETYQENTQISASQMEAASRQGSIAHFRGNTVTYECYGSPLFHTLCPMRDATHIRPMKEWIHPDDWSVTRTKFDELRSGEIDSFTQIYRPICFGSLRYYRTTLTRDNCEEENWCIGILQDVTQVILEQKRHQSDQIFWEELLDATPVLFFLKDADNDFRYVSVNRAFVDFIGKSKEEIIGKNDREIYLFNEHFLDEDKQAVQSTEALCFDNEVVSPQGKKRFYRTFKKRYPGYDGRNYVVGVGVDQTDQWTLLQDLKIMNESLSTVFDSNGLNSTIRLMMERLCKHLGASHCYLMDFDDTTMKVTCNHEYVVPGQGGLLFLNKKIWDYSYTDLWYNYILQHQIFVFQEDSDDEYAKAFRLFISIVSQSTSPLDIKTVYVAVTGDRKHVVSTLNFVFTKSRPHFSKDRVENLISVAIQLIQSMRERQKHQDEVGNALRKIEYSNLAKDTAILNEAVVHFCLETMLREDDPFEAGRKSLARMCGHLSAPRGFFFIFHPERGTMELLFEYSKNDVMMLTEGMEYPYFKGLQLYERLQKEDMATLPNLFENLSVGNIDSSWKEILSEHHLTNVYAHRIMQNNELYGFFAVAYENKSRNLTGVNLDFISAVAHCFELLLERKKSNDALVTALEKSLAANKAKNFFLASVSHELRTPLNAVVALTDLLKKGKMSESEITDCFESISYSSDALLHFVNNLLDLAQLESGTLPLSPKPTDFPELCREVLEPFSFVAKAKGLALEQKIDVNSPLLLDPFRMRQILSNVIDNAIKHTERGSISLDVLFKPSEDVTNGTLVIAIRDTGIGMKEEDRKSLMEPFVRLSHFRGTNATNQGSGLGVSIVKRLVLHMGGTFEIDSKLGHGTTFHIVLNQIPVAPMPEDPGTTIEKRVSYSLLLVDDVPLNLMVLKTVCKKANFQDIVAVESGQAALKELKTRSFDLVLTDLWMPGMSGEELAKKMRANKHLRKIPIVAVTADISAVENFDMRLFAASILKPVTLDKIKRLLSAIKTPK